jgi:hypothetical protein
MSVFESKNLYIYLSERIYFNSSGVFSFLMKYLFKFKIFGYIVFILREKGLVKKGPARNIFVSLLHC